MAGNGWRILGWGVAASLLLLPLAAMQFTDEVNWTPLDFTTFGVMLLAVGVPLELAVRTTRNAAYRAGAALALLGAFFMVWVNLAVGIIGHEQNPANLLFFGVLLVGIAGAAIAGFRPVGTARALVATALAQATVAAVVIVDGALEVALISVFYVGVWLAAAALFRRAAVSV